MTTSSRARARAAAAALSLLLAGLPHRAGAQGAPTAADMDTARAQFKEARGRREAGDLAGALARFRAAYALAPTPVTALELGRTHLQMGHLLEARELFFTAARMPRQPDESAKSDAARDEGDALAAALGPRIPAVHIVLEGVPNGAAAVVVKVDGVAIPEAARDAPRRVDPGEHEVAASLGDGPPSHQRVTLAEGEMRDVVLVLRPAAPAASVRPTDPLRGAVPPTAPSSPPPRHLGPLFWVGVGVTSAGVAVGTVSGVMAMSKADGARSACPALQCPSAGAYGGVATGRTLGDVSTVAFAAAGAGAALAVYGWIVSPRADGPARAPERGDGAPSGAPRAAISPLLGPGFGGVEGRF